MPTTGLTHFDAGGAAIMVDVSGKNKTHREAIASGRICVSEAVYAAITAGTAKKGGVRGHDPALPPAAARQVQH